MAWDTKALAFILILVRRIMVVNQSQKTQGFCVADFATLSDETRSSSKIFPLFIWIKEPYVRKFEGLERSKLLGISQTKISKGGTFPGGLYFPLLSIQDHKLKSNHFEKDDRFKTDLLIHELNFNFVLLSANVSGLVLSSLNKTICRLQLTECFSPYQNLPHK